MTAPEARNSASRADSAPARCLHQAFEAQARRTPGAPALVTDAGIVAYRELDARAGRLAAHLAALGVRPEVRVGLCLERSPDLVVAMLAVLKAGGAYVPLDPAHPAERLRGMMIGTETAVLVTQESLRLAVDPPPGVRVVSVDGDGDKIAAAAPARLAAADPRNLAYVIHTSGSTGAPKGIAVEHAGVAVNLADWTGRFGIGPGDRSLFVSSPGFDLSVFETLGMLGVGAAVVIPSHAETREPAHWAAEMRRHGVTVWNSATALLGMLADHLDARPQDAPPALRLAFVGGDRVPLALAGRLRAHVPALRVVALGGVTEVSIYSTLYEIREVDPAWTGIPYGMPMAGQRAWVLDERLRPVAAGESGEMYIGGAGVARGYAGRPGFTAERFLPDPFADRPGARMYRTGDRVRWMAQADPANEFAATTAQSPPSRTVAAASLLDASTGACDSRGGERTHALTHSRTSVLEFLGRMDAQVKIRGNRVEPGEVEAVLRRAPGVAACAVAARGGDTGEARLVAYVVGPAQAPDLREHARRTLPDYMVPSVFVALDALPLSPNGKVDRRALPDPDLHAAAAPYVAPETAVERALAEIWKDVLRVERVGAMDDFFDLGGESALVARLAAAVRDATGMELSLRTALAHPTLRAMAAELERRLYDEIVSLPEEQAERLAVLDPMAGGAR